jgi:hypothetical protein
MNSLKKLASFWAVCLIACGLAASVYAHDAKVVKLTGDVQVQLPGESEAKPLTADMAIPQGSTIVTGPGAEVYVEALPGDVATIKANTTVSIEKLAHEQQGGVVTSQEALLDLKKGNIISTLDPTKKAINHYGVKTPKGVAAARGTVYGTSVTFAGGESTTTVATMTGVVTLNLGNDSNGDPVLVQVPFGQAATTAQAGATTASLEAAIAASGQNGLTVAELLQQAVEAVAGNVAANTSAAGGSDTATAVLAAVVSAASSAQPQKADQFVNTAVAAAVSSGSSTSGSTATSNAAVAAIVSAGVQAAPSSAATISQGAAATVVQTKTTQAAAAASASGGDAAAVQQAVAAAVQEAGEALSTITQTAVNTAAAAGSSVSATAITTAVNTGSQTGAAAAAATTNVSVPPPANVSQPTTSTQQSPVLNTPQTTVDLPPVSPTAPVQ